ncbi:PREDICTED: putative uncharacterized protein FLJ37770 [Diuraphis noxia]|uniref:putative uncharacterized protein FLJ37770 n=1 Tax=Diuraphis noxia TaxID=143948 RepID=UPI000763699A|nr:PREDICTED: putative uncharacterized protein FLJ37770 [Diuraphis noxia]
MEELKSQRICIKFCVKNEIKCNKVCELLQKAYGESAMKKTSVYEWYKRFQDGRKDVEDDESQLEKLLMKLAYRLVHVITFFQMFWA